MPMNLSISSAKFSIVKRKLSVHRHTFIRAFQLAAVVVAGVAIVRLVGAALTSFRTLVGPPLSTLALLQDPAKTLASTDGRTNILILGRGGATHEAPDLTDTMIVLSVRHADSQATLLSLPRDLWIDSMKAKINSAYYYGEQKEPGGGFTLARDAVFQVTDLPIHYAVLVDFEGFKKAIDLVGGIEVEVRRAFSDEKYPVEKIDDGELTDGEPIYEALRFEAGEQHMDGATALKFARSRNSSDPEEGTDFARGRRQQQILLALASKIKQRETVFSLERIKQLREIFSRYTVTDMSDEELVAFGRVGMKIDPGNIRYLGVNTGTEDEPGLLTTPPLARYGQWVLVPTMGNWTAVHEYIAQQLAL